MGAGMDDNWITDVLDRVDERCARECAERETGAGRFSGIYWLVFFAVTLGVPVLLGHYTPQFTDLIGSVSQSLIVGLAG